MSDEPFVMLSLKDDKAKKLANALTNKSANKILTYLANHDNVTEAQIAKALKVPISTVNYTMKMLVEAKLVVSDEYSYSAKGREVNHYKLAKKYIIIAPEEEKAGFLDSLKKFLPATLLTVAGAGIVRLWQLFSGSTAAFAEPTALRAAPMAAEMHVAQDMAVEESANLALQAAPVVLENTPLDWFGPFLLGVTTVLILAMLVDYVRRR